MILHPVIWKGWVAKSYGPGARHRVPRMPVLYWRIEGRAAFGNRGQSRRVGR